MLGTNAVQTGADRKVVFGQLERSPRGRRTDEQTHTPAHTPADTHTRGDPELLRAAGVSADCGWVFVGGCGFVGVVATGNKKLIAHTHTIAHARARVAVLLLLLLLWPLSGHSLGPLRCVAYIQMCVCVSCADEREWPDTIA